MKNRIGNFLRVFWLYEFYERNSDKIACQRQELWIPIKNITKIRSYDEMMKSNDFRSLENFITEKNVSMVEIKDSVYFCAENIDVLLDLLRNENL